MFGYVKTDLPNMYVKDTVLYKAMYCGLCKGIGKVCGQKGRLALNYDLTFLSVFVHNILDLDVNVENQRCIIHQIKKRPVAVPDKVTERIAALNVILAFHKLNDDVIDNNKGRLKRCFFKGAYKRAKKAEPILDSIVSKRYKELLEYENKKCDSIDMAADPFANMMQDIVCELLKEKYNENIGQLAYNLGKWVYLIDALDDYDKDKKKSNFNVFANAYPDIESKQGLIKEKGGEIVFIFSNIFEQIDNLSKSMNYKFNHDLIDNILLRGLKTQTKQIMECKKCKTTIKY